MTNDGIDVGKSIFFENNETKLVERMKKKGRKRNEPNTPILLI